MYIENHKNDVRLVKVFLRNRFDKLGDFFPQAGTNCLLSPDLPEFIENVSTSNHSFMLQKKLQPSLYLKLESEMAGRTWLWVPASRITKDIAAHIPL